MALDDIGFSGTGQEGQFPAIYKELIDIFDELVIQLKTSIRNKGLKASGRLSASIVYDKKNLGNIYSFQLSMEDYWKDVEQGTKPHHVPIKALMEWIAAKQITPKLSKQSKKLGFKNKDATKSFAYMIQKSIEKKGTIKRFGYKGSNFYTEVIPSKQDFLKSINKRLSEALKRDVLVQIKHFA